MRFLIIGGVAAALHGSTTLTEHIVITYDRSPTNLERVAAALAAHPRGVEPGLPIALDAPAMRNGLKLHADDALR
ncbi:MAG TPA: hypothetical protein VF998_08705 [Candidatus Limnocylindria bacterium]